LSLSGLNLQVLPRSRGGRVKEHRCRILMARHAGKAVNTVCKIEKPWNDSEETIA
jgi:hypothetical protein